jgi:probable HAF family extracellular repeat protein
MRKNLSSLIALFSVCTPLAFLAVSSAQNTQAPATPQHHHYKLVDVGTLGGPTSYFSNGFDGLLNNHGMAAGWSDTSIPDPNTAFCFNPDCFVSHAFQSQNGVLTDLGALAGGVSSQAFWITENGLIIGNSQNGEFDPLFSGFPENRGVLWQNGGITDLGTLPEGGYESFASAVNSRGQAVGFALNTIPDPFSLAGPGFFPTQTRAFLWQNGAMQDLGTLGGSGAFAYFVNEGGQIAGQSYTNSTPNPVTGIPTIDPFLWENGTMLDLGSLGGTLSTTTAFNNRGDIVGSSYLAGDLKSHPYLWTKNRGMQDLGTLGGDNGVTNWVNEAGDIAGKADLPGPKPQNHDAVLWKNGVILDLGTLSGESCANAYYVNARGQVVGTSENRELCSIPAGEHAFLWENGGPMVDLNDLIPPGSALQLTFAVAVNNGGEIAGFGVPTGCAPQDVGFCGHAYVLIPCDENHPNVEGCDYSLVAQATAAVEVRRAEITQAPAASLSGQYPAGMMSRFGFLTAGRNRPYGMRQTSPKAAVNGQAAVSAPSAALSPTTLTFSTQAIGTTSAAKTVTLKNTGTTSLTITAIAIAGTNAGDFAQTHTCGGSLFAGASCSISLTFKPTASGTRTAALRVTDNAAGSPQQVTLSGIGSTARLSPVSLGFSTQAIGTTSAAKSVTLTNVGATALTITGIAVSGTNAGDFAQTHTCGSSSAAGASCSISVTFKPTASGARSAALSVTDNAIGSPQQVPLGGIGTTAELFPTSLNFGTVAIGTTSPAKTVTLTNVGTTTISIAGIAITGINAGDFAQTQIHTCGSSLAPGATCSIGITFKPTASGTRTAALSVSDNAAGSPQTITLNGNCVGGKCGEVGQECGAPQLSPCCPGLVCVPASTRAFCEL